MWLKDGIQQIVEASATFIKVAVEKIVGEHDGAAGTTGAKILLNAHSGNPPPVSDDFDNVRQLGTPLGQARVYLDSHLNRTNDEVLAEDIPPPECVGGGRHVKVNAVGTPDQITSVSKELKRGIWIQVDPDIVNDRYISAHHTSAANSIWDQSNTRWNVGPTLCKTASVAGRWLFFPGDDSSKWYWDSPHADAVILTKWL